jgi:hypothetical protein
VRGKDGVIPLGAKANKSVMGPAANGGNRGSGRCRTATF